MNRWSDREPTLAERIAANLQTRIESGKMRAGVRLPSIRNYAAELSVSRHGVVEAYERLIAKGLVESRRSSGIFFPGKSLQHIDIAALDEQIELRRSYFAKRFNY